MSKPAEALQPVRGTSQPGAPTATLEEIDIRTALLSRGHRPVDHEREADALSVLAREMADNPRNMLQKLVETALDVCTADTAGLSLLEGDVFRWEAIAGVFAAHRNGTMPRDASPCGICTSENSTQLMSLPDRCFPALRAEPRFVEALLIPFHNHGKAVGTVWIVAHTPERKFDGEDERFVRTLAQFASAGWQLWTAYESATSSSRRKDEFLAMLGHELRNPLAAIVNGAAILEKLGTNPAIASAAGLVARQAKHSSRIVDDVLDVSRIGCGKLRLQNATVELGSVVVQALDTVRAQIDRRLHRVVVEMPAEPIYLDCDPDRIAQVLSNLLDNAAKHTPDGGDIRVSGALDGRNVRITVKDTGIGIPKERIDSVFDLFTQAGGPLDHGDPGLGLGLTLVRRLVEMHGGSVEAASAGPGLGSRFTIHLPASAARRPQAGTNGSPPAPVSPAASNASWTKAQ